MDYFCTLCKDTNFIDYSICNCYEMFLCIGCSELYFNACLNAGIPACCFKCSDELMKDNMTSRVKENYWKFLSKKLSSNKTFKYHYPTSKHAITTLKKLKYDFGMIISKTVPKGISISLALLEEKELKDLIEEKNTKINKKIKKLFKSLEIVCDFCKNQLNDDNVCSTCSISYCKECGYELFPHHKCSKDRITKMPNEICLCPSEDCGIVLECFMGQNNLQCGECKIKYSVEDLEPYRMTDDFDDGEFKDNLKILEQNVENPEILNRFETFEIYSDWKNAVYKKKNLVMIELSTKSKFDNEERISSKFIKKSFKPKSIPDIEEITKKMCEEDSSHMEEMKELRDKRVRRLEKQLEKQRLKEEEEKEEKEKADEKRKRKEDKKKRKEDLNTEKEKNTSPKKKQLKIIDEKTPSPKRNSSPPKLSRNEKIKSKKNSNEDEDEGGKALRVNFEDLSLKDLDDKSSKLPATKKVSFVNKKISSSNYKRNDDEDSDNGDI